MSAGFAAWLITISAVVFVALVLLVIERSRAEAARTKSLRAWAEARGYSPDADVSDEFVRELHTFPWFGYGRAGEVSNAFTYTLDTSIGALPARAGDYEFTTGYGKTERRVRFSYLRATLPFEAERIFVRKEGMLDTVLAAVGLNDIDFEDIAFSDRYSVSSDDREFAYALLDPRVIEFLTELEPAPSFETLDDRIVLVAMHGFSIRSDYRWTPAQFDEQIEVLRTIMDSWPKHLAARLRAESDAPGLGRYPESRP